MARALAEDGEAIQAFLRSDKPSTAQELITFLKGIAFAAGRGIDGQGNATLHNIVANGVESSDYHRGMVDGEGFGVYRDDTGMAVFEVDKLNVRRKATFAELEVKQLAFTTGDVGFTSASARLAMVKPSEDGDMYRCYFLAEDDDHAISNDWRVGDQAMCKTANLLSRTTKQASNRYYWRLVVNTGEETVSGKLYYFIDLSDIKGSLDLTIDGKQYACVGYDTSTENDAPQAEDDIIQLGSQTDPDRQYAYILYVSEGRRVDYAGINDFNLTTHIVNEFSPRGTTIRSDSFKIVSGAGTGTSSPIVCDRGEWQTGTIAGHYDRFSYQGSLWLYVAKEPSAEAPSDKSTKWIKQVAQGVAGEQGAAPVMLNIYSDGGNFIRNRQGSVTLTAVVTKANVDITSTFPPSSFSWIRHSGNATYDEAWNGRHKGVGSTVTIKAEDVDKRTVFECVLDD